MTRARTILIALGVAFLVGVAPATANERIAFVRRVQQSQIPYDAKWSIGAIDAAGSAEQVVVGPHGSAVVGIGWLANGDRVAFADVPRFGERRIRSAEANGGGTTTILNCSSLVPACSSPVPSPDGTRIAFVADAGIYVMDSDGSDVESVVSCQSPGCELRGPPDWYPDGTGIVFAIVSSGMSSIVFKPLGPPEPSVATPCGNIPCSHPDLSPDGEELAFKRDGNIWVLHLPDGDAHRLTECPEAGCRHAGQPEWSTSGNRIAYVSWAKPRMFGSLRPRIFLMTHEGRFLRKIVGNAFDPAWQSV